MPDISQQQRLLAEMLIDKVSNTAADNPQQLNKLAPKIQRALE